MTIIDSLYTELEETRSIWTDIYDLLKQAQYDTKSPRPAIENVSVDVLNGRALLVFDLIFGVRPTSDNEVNTLILSSKASEIQGQITAFKSQAQAVLNQMRSNWRETCVIRDGNENFNWQFFVEASNTANINVAPNFTPMNSALNQLLGHAALLLPICKANGVSDLLTRSQALAEVVREIESLRNEAKKLPLAQNLN